MAAQKLQRGFEWLLVNPIADRESPLICGEPKPQLMIHVLKMG